MCPCASGCNGPWVGMWRPEANRRCLHHSFTLLWGVWLPLNPGHTVTARLVVLEPLGCARLCSHFPGVVFQTPCSFHVLLRVRTWSSCFCSKRSPHLTISPALLGITLLKHYLNRAKDMVLLTVLALHAGDSGLDPSTTQLGGEGKN